MRKLLQQRLGKYEISIVFIVYFIGLCARPTSQQTNCEPVNIGLIAALPWDVANTLRAPIGGPVSLALSCVMALILLFGFVLSPINYILGYPPRIYHPARATGLISNLYPIPPLKIKKEKEGRSLENEGYELLEHFSKITNETLFGEYEIDDQRVAATHKFPDFESTAFSFIPERDLLCQKLIICHAHGFLQIFPGKLTKVLRYFSKRVVSVPSEYKDAVLVGLRNQGDCRIEFKCGKEIATLLKEALYDVLSSEMKAFWNLRKLF